MRKKLLAGLFIFGYLFGWYHVAQVIDYGLKLTEQVWPTSEPPSNIQATNPKEFAERFATTTDNLQMAIDQASVMCADSKSVSITIDGKSNEVSYDCGRGGGIVVMGAASTAQGNDYYTCTGSACSSGIHNNTFTNVEWYNVTHSQDQDGWPNEKDCPYDKTKGVNVCKAK